jgi:hypothetical protein
MSLRTVYGKTGVTTNPPVSPFRKGGAESPSKGGVWWDLTGNPAFCAGPTQLQSPVIPMETGIQRAHRHAPLHRDCRGLTASR